MPVFTHNSKVEALAKVPLLASLSKKELTSLARVAEDLEFPAGRKLATEGARGREFFAIVEGEIELTKKGKKVATMGPGEYCGEFALIMGGPRLTTATAVTPVRVFVLTERHFKQLIKTHPGVELKIMRSLVAWLRRVLNEPALSG